MKFRKSILILAAALSAVASHADDGRPVAERVARIAKEAGLAAPAPGAEGPRVDLATVRASIARLAVSRQQLRRLLLQKGRRLTKDQIAEGHGSISGSSILGIGGFSGSFSFQQDEILLKGGEFFVLSTIDPKVADLSARISLQKKRLSKCVPLLAGIIDAARAKAIDAASLADVKARVANFQSSIDGLEVDAASLPANDSYKTLYDEIKTWGRGSEIRVFAVNIVEYEFDHDPIEINFVNNYSSLTGRCSDEIRPERLKWMFDENFPVTQIDVSPVY